MSNEVKIDLGFADAFRRAAQEKEVDLTIKLSEAVNRNIELQRELNALSAEISTLYIKMLKIHGATE